ncbi:MAG: hypothetical protein K9K30_07405 [Burkholderiaceae bacterium]|nr:hypothetical protein [Sulfuritalea sp.]MCF8175049.1 hypothetical protein [Burkholderiaceae bacterium]MCF8184729.1 hypothetical protein [Polynucleobacter sp.]
MAEKKSRDWVRKSVQPDSALHGRVIAAAITHVINRGFVVGREVLVGSVPGVVVGYNIARYGQFIGSDYPLVVRTALGVTKCDLDEVSLA